MNLSISLDVHEIIYDIQNKTYLTGRSRSDGKNYRQVALMQANNDDENINQIMRSISSALARVKNELAELLGTGIVAVSNKTDLAITDKEFLLAMPSNFNSKAADAVAAAIHEYVVSSSIADWFMITNKADAADYEVRARESLELLRESIYKRSRPTRSSDTGSGSQESPEV